MAECKVKKTMKYQSLAQHCVPMRRGDSMGPF
eukprot:CAMPEP_0174366266 /NCGR_PEP_ID=MMETSP0811_2-20130205/80574_1 /TAXON_ID=73025 ORGANISM="Eutreptiella gymnastica-like, Strain CCMP1594" /NCGR_SAMPLE_ID=MMETSP0811_2 /ASSEMBLY_ACC=CAM_ASM_000667 /LENGTH=31 /DNA_ID= /DNA_START= /DNA_END= /DNA_ORIENTATION=